MRGSRPLKADELEKIRVLFRGRMGTRNLAMFLFGANTGFRISELLSLTLDDVLEKNGSIKKRVSVSRRNMKGKISGRNVLLNSYGRNGIRPWLLQLRDMLVTDKDDFLFRAMGDANRAISRQRAWRVLVTVYKAAGLVGKLGTHAMRKTYANNVYNGFLARTAKGEAVDAFRSTSKALGHTDIKSTDQYLSFLTEDIDETIEAVGV